ncbi:MAG TPA: tRNA (adenosine(37)-N6)-threonylcarbamoyltransferase complex dimerization subunit type 1 TsaB [Candidatus Acidoferrum sp.]|jgi:tRNA threonylcarbamoyladenosine biosynthesis protein TsaB
MNLLALDTCDSRGSVSVLRDVGVLATVEHNTPDDYSIWLLPAIDRALLASGLTFKDIDVYVAAAGPGSFTGVRVGLTTVKAWAEVTSKPIVAVSRLEALATQANAASTSAPASAPSEFVAAFANGQRQQIFAALYRRNAERQDARQNDRLQRIGDEAVIAPDKFLAWAIENSAAAPIHWISTDPQMLTETEAWSLRQTKTDGAVAAASRGVQAASPILAPAIGKLGYHLATMKQFSDPLTLDANYVRRSDAEVSWIDRHQRASKTAG